MISSVLYGGHPEIISVSVITYLYCLLLKRLQLSKTLRPSKYLIMSLLSLSLEPQTRFKAVNIQALMREDSSSVGNDERHNGVGQATWGSSGGPSFASVVGSADSKPVGVGQRRGGGEVRGGRNSNSSVGVSLRSKETWVSTGDAVASQYERARKEAAELAR